MLDGVLSVGLFCGPIQYLTQSLGLLPRPELHMAKLSGLADTPTTSFI